MIYLTTGGNGAGRRSFQTEDEGSFLLDVLKIALGVFIGSLAAVFTYEAIVAFRAEQAVRKVLQETKAQTDRINAEAAKRSQQEAQERQEAEQRAEQVRNARALAARLEAERQARRDAAWSKFYQPSPSCKMDSGTAACANEYMAARKRFDSQYVDR